MKRKKLAFLLALSLTFTSFSGTGLNVYAEELPEIVEDETGEVETIEYGEQDLSANEETDATERGTAETDVSENIPESEETVQYGKFVESVEVVDGTENVPAYLSDEADEAGFEIEGEDGSGCYREEKWVHPGENVKLTVPVKAEEDVALSYQWYIYEQEEYEKISGVTEKTYEICAISKDTYLKCEVTNTANGQKKQAEYEVQIDSGLFVSNDSGDIYAYPDEKVILSVDASTIYGELEYKWVKLSEDSDEEIPVSTARKCEVPAKNAEYICYVSNGYESDAVYRNVYVFSGLQVKDGWKTYSARVGEKVTLSVEASTEMGKLTYQWYKEVEDGGKALIDGATDAVYEIQAEPVNNEYAEGEQSYCCVVSDGYTSEKVWCNVQVKADNYITVEDKEWNHVDVKWNESKELSVTATTKSGILSYQWYSRQSDLGVDAEYTMIAGANAPTLKISNMTKDTDYYCEISNGDIKKRVDYFVNVDTGLSVKEGYSQYKYIQPGGTVTLSVHASTPIGTLTYSWYKNEGESSDMLGTSDCIIVDKEGEYSCKIENGYEEKWIYYTVAETAGIELISQGGHIQIPYGQSAVLKAEAKAAYGTLTYTWYKNDTTVVGREKTLEIPWKEQKGMRDTYTCVVNSKELPEYVGKWSQKKVRFYVSMEKKNGLLLEAPEYVSVPYGGSTTLSVNVQSNENKENLKYSWYICDSYENRFLSRSGTLKLDNITSVEQYKCRVWDGEDSNWVKIYVGPEEQLKLCTEDYEHAKILTPDNQPCSAMTCTPFEYAYFSFTPDKSGNWLIYSTRNDDSGDIVLEDSNLTLLAEEDRDGGSFSLGTELQAGKTYCLRCYPYAGSGTNFTFCAKYLDEDLHEHTWDSGAATKQPTCVETGIKTYTCVECKETRTEEIPATGAHTLVTVTDRAATCGSAGSQHQECTVCHKREASISIPATGAHTMVTVTDRAATCGASGSQHQECMVCHKREASISISATGAHKFGPYVITKQPTVLAAGEQVRTCGVCGKTEKVNIPKMNGTMTLKANKVPLQLKKTMELKNIVTGLMPGDAIVSYSSDNKKVAEVSQTGKVTAKKTGKAIITITLASGMSNSVTVQVQKGAVKTTKISGVPSKATLETGKRLELAPIVTPITTKDKLSYTSSNKKVATVSKNGVITAKASGKAKITIKSGSKKFVLTVTVPKKAPTGMQGVPAAKSLKKGKSFTIKAKLLPAGAEAKVSYKSSDKKVVTVNAKGKVTAKKAGTAVITVTAGGIKQTCTVTVK